MSNLPNLITLARLFAVPLTVWLILEGDLKSAFWVFIAAGISDGVDGFLARQFNWRSDLGAILDPIADKALLVSIFVALGMQELIPAWIVVLVVSRDVMIVGAILLAWGLDHEVAIDPAAVSKANTAAQIAFAGTALAAMGYQLQAEALLEIGVIVVAATTLTSGLTYLIRWGHIVGLWGTGPAATDESGDGGA